MVHDSAGRFISAADGCGSVTQAEGAKRLSEILPPQLESCSVLLPNSGDCVSACALVVYHQMIMCLFPFASLRDFVLKIKSHDASGLVETRDLPPSF